MTLCSDSSKKKYGKVLPVSCKSGASVLLLPGDFTGKVRRLHLHSSEAKPGHVSKLILVQDIGRWPICKMQI